MYIQLTLSMFWSTGSNEHLITGGRRRITSGGCVHVKVCRQPRTILVSHVSSLTWLNGCKGHLILEDGSCLQSFTTGREARAPD